ncbi:hypothetical protein B9Z55_023414 [Caenorhabditis nigoni]|uniref:Uncharacterized protein n=1 Tax=Caenorhabditis nigoni TaxID=1611254 RepID=A0A2G5SPT7_9PELO|nr:hypothetical protein B9Z55_023414 [Caenorhabditis nigoni]
MSYLLVRRKDHLARVPAEYRFLTSENDVQQKTLQVLQHLETEIDSKEQSASFQHYLPHLMKSVQETTFRGSLAEDLYQLNLLTSSTSREANSANSTTSSLKIPDTYTIATPGKENDVTILSPPRIGLFKD